MNFLRPLPETLQSVMGEVERTLSLKTMYHSIWKTTASPIGPREVLAGFAVCCLACNYPSARAAELYRSLKHSPDNLFPSQARLDSDRSSIETQFNAATLRQPPPYLLSIWTNIALLDLYEYMGIPAVPSKDYKTVRNALLNEYAEYDMMTSSVPLNNLTKGLCIFEALMGGPFPDDWSVNHVAFIGVIHEWKQLRTHFTPGLGR